MKTLKDAYVVRDQFGVGQSGKTVIYYPWKTEANGSTAVPGTGTGKYVVTIDPTSNNNKICRYYDIYVDGEKHDEQVFIGQWEWFVRIQFTDTDLSQDFLFTDLVDENGYDVPDSIPKAIVGIMCAEADRHFSISAQDDSGFTIDAAAGGGAQLPIYIKLHITVKEPS